MDAITAYRLVSSNRDLAIERIASRSDVTREVDHYLANIGSIQSAEDLVKDYRLFNFVMRAYGLEDLSYARAMMRNIMEQGTDDPDALANRLTDPRYRELANDFNFARYGEATTAFGRTQQGVVDKFIRQSMENETGLQNEGARLALYFERKAASIDSEVDLLADKALLAVVRTALQLPAQMSLASVDKQVDMIKQRFDISDLQDPEELGKFINRFLALWEVGNPSASPSVPLIGTAPAGFGLSIDILASLQTLKRG